jgi:phospholipase/carboxylesterase
MDYFRMLRRLTRRRALAFGAAGLAGGIVSCAEQRREPGGARSPGSPEARPEPSTAPPTGPGRLRARPSREATGDDRPPGTHALGVTSERDALLYIPAGHSAEQAAPLVLLFHGAGGNAAHGLSLLQPLADQSGLLLVAAASRGSTWDVIRGGYGPDVAQVDQALDAVFARFRVDPGRVAVGGFSDGASYALSLGLTNGDLFSHIVAFSPGFMAPAAQVGQPQVYVSHGTRDQVLPIDRCSRRIVPQLDAAGYAVRYHEFDGPHTVPAAIAQEAADWFLGAA